MFELHAMLRQETVIVGQFKLSMVLLHKDANYPWCILVPKRENIREIHHLLDEDQSQLIRESSHLSEIMTSLFAPTTMNIAALGNVTPQLHLHHVARFEGDPAWPGAIWNAKPAKVYDADTLNERLTRLRATLIGEGFEASGIVEDGDSSNAGFTP